MNLNYTVVGNPQALSQDELLLEYDKLSKSYKGLKEDHENDLQKIYELKRNNQTLLSTESYLSSELETINSANQNEIDSINQKNQAAVDLLKNEIINYKANHVILEAEYEELRQQLEEAHKVVINRSVEMVYNNDNSMREHALEKEIQDVTALMEEIKKKYADVSAENLEFMKEIETLKDKIVCLEDNLVSKKGELYETQQILESTQECMMELNSELAIFKNVPEAENKKGNSLFAEVDDQRQKMQRVLAAQKKHYLQMKQAYSESEFEIRKLKRENIAMRQEIKTCSELFNQSEITYIKQMNSRISELTSELQKTRKRLEWTENKLVEMSKDKGVNWVESIMTFCKNETKEIKEQLYNARVEKRFIDEDLHNKQKELAKWRFEAIKSRMIVTKLQYMLEDNNIAVDPVEQIEVNLPSNTEIQAAQPNTSYQIEIYANLTMPNDSVVIKQEVLGTDTNNICASICPKPKNDDEEDQIMIKSEIKSEPKSPENEECVIVEPKEEKEIIAKVANTKSILGKNKDFTNFLSDKRSVSFPEKEEHLVQSCEIPASGNKENANFKIKSKVLVKRIIIPSHSKPKN